MFDDQGVHTNGLRLFSAVTNIEFWSHESGPVRLKSILMVNFSAWSHA